MDRATRSRCDGVVAYLKQGLPGGGSPGTEAATEDPPILRPFCGDLLVAYVVDEGKWFRYLQTRDLTADGLDEQRLHEMAVRNLRDLARDRTKVHEYGHVYAVLAGGDLEASLLLVPEFWDDWCADLAPDGFVATAPARDILAFGDAASPGVLEELRAVRDRLGPNPDHPLTRSLLRREAGRWQPIGP